MEIGEKSSGWVLVAAELLVSVMAEVLAVMETTGVVIVEVFSVAVVAVMLAGESGSLPTVLSGELAGEVSSTSSLLARSRWRAEIQVGHCGQVTPCSPQGNLVRWHDSLLYDDWLSNGASCGRSTVVNVMSITLTLGASDRLGLSSLQSDFVPSQCDDSGEGDVDCEASVAKGGIRWSISSRTSWDVTYCSSRC